MKQFAIFLFLFSLADRTIYGQLPSTPKLTGCSVHAAMFHGWNAQEVINPWVKLTFIPQLGGRLMQVEFNGHPYLFVNPKYFGKYISPEEAAGGWINYGGDKIWPMPEGNSDEHHWVLASTAIDDLPYDFKILSEGERCVVELTGKPDVITGLQYRRTIRLSADSPQISFHAVMKNATTHPIEWSVQSVSQYDLSDAQNPADYNHQLWAYTPVNPDSTYPDGYHVRSGMADDPSFSVAGDLFRLHWMYFENEVWLDSTAGWLAIVDQGSQYGMIERFTFQPTGNYPGKATVIFYKNGPSVSFDHEGHASIRATIPESTPYYMEAEINSPIIKLQSNETYAMDTTWNPVRISSAPQTVTNAGVVTQKLSAAWKGNSIALTGAFAPFTTGDVIVLLLDKHGTVIDHRVLKKVLPDETVVLNESIPATRNVLQLTLKISGTGDDILDKLQVEGSGGASK